MDKVNEILEKIKNNYIDRISHTIIDSESLLD